MINIWGKKKKVQLAHDIYSALPKLEDQTESDWVVAVVWFGLSLISRPVT